MAYYTITINSLMRNNFNFGLDDYPIYDENHREELNKSILNHYIMREIGFETAELFKIYLNQKMREIMPRYNVMYSAQLEVMNNLFSNVDLIENSQKELDRDITNDATTTTNTNETSNSLSNSKRLYQDTPQGSLKSTDIDEQAYATDLTLNKNDMSNNNVATANGTSNNLTNEDSVTKYYRKLSGNNGSKYPIEILNNIKFTISNIDEMIIKDLDELFMQIY